MSTGWAACFAACTMHCWPAHGSASYTTLVPRPIHLPVALCSLTAAHIRQKNPHMIIESKSYLFKVNNQIGNWRSFDFTIRSCRVPKQGRVYKSISELTLPKEVSYSGCAASDTVRYRRLSYLCWFALTRSHLKRRADNDLLWRRDEQRSLEEEDADCSRGKTVGVGGRI